MPWKWRNRRRFDHHRDGRCWAVAIRPKADFSPASYHVSVKARKRLRNSGRLMSGSTISHFQLLKSYQMTGSDCTFMKVRATVVCENNRNVLFVRKANKKWSLPGGKVKCSEGIASAAARELKEETGLETEPLIYLFEFNGGDTLHHVFTSTISDRENAIPQNEIIECVWQPLRAYQDLGMNDATRFIIELFIRRL